MKLRFFAATAALVCLSNSAAAHAELPAPVRAMIDAAVATGDASKVATVIEMAKATNAGDLAEIEVIENAYLAEQEELAAQTAAAQEAEIRSAGVLDNWTGRGEIGAFRNTGNSNNIGVTAALKLERIGIDWRHKLRVLADYQRSNGVTTREQVLAAYEPSYDVSGNMFVYGLAQYERDRFQGYSARYSASAGIGYRVLDSETAQLSVKGGPAYRRTKFVTGGTTSHIAALAALDFDFSLTERLKLTEDASAYFEAGSSTYISATGIEADLGGSLSARLSYTIEHDTNPPAGSVQTDTLSRFTLIYGF